MRHIINIRKNYKKSVEQLLQPDNSFGTFCAIASLFNAQNVPICYADRNYRLSKCYLELKKG